ncbi:DUF4340 domain-containing protein [Zavarzinia sp.]|uniref:DUF4340 domain-containing protein n=1 Tax=Zavarzinia sp. TaxID=2027920 RepID=UPI00356A4C2F
MRRSTLAILLGLTVVLALLGAYLVLDRVRETSADLSGRPMLPSLKTVLNDVSEIDVGGAEGGFTLKRQAGDHWVMPERSLYPVDFGKVQRLLIALAELKAIEPKTKHPERHHFLEVEDIAAGAKGLRLTVKTGDTVVADLIVGKPVDVMGADRVPRFYVRMAGDPQAWEGEADLKLERDPASWLNQDLLVISPERFRAAAVTIGEQNARISRDKPEASFALDGMTDKETLKSARAGALAVAATYLTLQDVRPAADAAKGKPMAKVVFETFDGIVITLDMVTIDGQGWTTIGAAFDPAIAEAGKAVQGPPGPDGASQFKDAEAAKAEAGAIAARTKGWLYRLDGTRVIDLTPTRADLVDAKPDGAAPAPAMPPGMPAMPGMPGMPMPDIPPAPSGNP